MCVVSDNAAAHLLNKLGTCTVSSLCPHFTDTPIHGVRRILHLIGIDDGEPGDGHADDMLDDGF